MKTTIELLDQYYRSVDNAKISEIFFFHLADYVNHIKKTKNEYY